MQIKDRIFILTGASSGIGLSTIALSERGAKVALLGRSTVALQELTHKPPGSLPVTVDMTQFESRKGSRALLGRVKYELKEHNETPWNGTPQKAPKPDAVV